MNRVEIEHLSQMIIQEFGYEKIDNEKIISFFYTKNVFQMDVVLFFVKKRNLSLKDADELVSNAVDYCKFKEGNQMLKESFFNS